jgi:hypothetical protein
MVWALEHSMGFFEDLCRLGYSVEELYVLTDAAVQDQRNKQFGNLSPDICTLHNDYTSSSLRS